MLVHAICAACVIPGSGNHPDTRMEVHAICAACVISGSGNHPDTRMEVHAICRDARFGRRQ